MAISTLHRPKTRARQNRPLEDYYEEQRKKGSRLPGVSIGQRFNISSGIIFYGSICFILIAVILGATYFIQHRACAFLNIEIAAEGEGALISKEEVEGMLITEHRPLIGLPMKDISLSELEHDLRSNPYVKEAEIFKSLSGGVEVHITSREPMARIINNNGMNIYLDEEGWKFPTSVHYSAHVPLIRGNFDEIVFPQDSFDCRIIEATLPVLNYIHKNEFWWAQISEILIKENGELILYPQVGKAFIEFGLPERIAEKFDNLRLFYREVFNKHGWDEYKGLSVKYRQQVVGIK